LPIGVLVTIVFSVISVMGDYFLKLSSAREQPLRTGWFYLGFALYASSAFGWVFVMRHLKLATISVLYSVWCCSSPSSAWCCFGSH
jgi:hypothetical protein